jgi:hypothetical protein
VQEIEMLELYNLTPEETRKMPRKLLRLLPQYKKITKELADMRVYG